MAQINHFQGLFFISAGFWMVFGLVAIFAVKKFIVQRYENETPILETVYFKEHFLFAKSLPDFFSSAIYSGHLIICAWGWNIFGKKKLFRDIDDPKEILKYFSAAEIRRAKLAFISGITILIHFIVLELFI